MAKIKISADTSPIKKSLVELSREITQLSKGGTKLSLISEKDRKFFKKDISQELDNVKKKIKENKGEISKLVTEASKLTKGSKEELKLRNDINNAYKAQARLAREANVLGKAQSSMSSGMTGGLLSKMGGPLGLLTGGLLAGGAWTLSKAARGRLAYMNSTTGRNQLSGLGLSGGFQGGAASLANAGLTEQEMIERRVGASRILGRGAGSINNILQQARFERAYGLEGGSLNNVATSLRANFGGKGANEAQMKLQASILANGIEDAIGPYLEAATGLLASINENGMTATSKMISVLGNLTAGSGRTPEQIARTFQGINSGIMGASGESNAFIQAAFARAGIGGGTIGGTRLAMSSGGLFGMDSSVMGGRYSSGLMKNLRGAGFFNNMGKRGSALLNQFKISGGLGAGDSISGITDVNRYVGMNSLANSVFGTQGAGGFEALQLLERAQSGKMSNERFKKELDRIKGGSDPVASRLDTVNKTLSGQLSELKALNENLTMQFGENQGGIMKGMLKTSNAVTGVFGSDRSSLKKSFSGIPEFNSISSDPSLKAKGGNLEKAINDNTNAIRNWKYGKSSNSEKAKIDIRVNGKKTKERTYK